MKIEFHADGKLIDTMIGGHEWIAAHLDERMAMLGRQHKTVSMREVPDDTPDLLKTQSGKPFWMD